MNPLGSGRCLLRRVRTPECFRASLLISLRPAPVPAPAFFFLLQLCLFLFLHRLFSCSSFACFYSCAGFFLLAPALPVSVPAPAFFFLLQLRLFLFLRRLFFLSRLFLLLSLLGIFSSCSSFACFYSCTGFSFCPCFSCFCPLLSGTSGGESDRHAEVA